MASNHIKGNWFISVFKMREMTQKQLESIMHNENYRYTTRRNAEQTLIDRKFDWLD